MPRGTSSAAPTRARSRAPPPAATSGCRSSPRRCGGCSRSCPAPRDGLARTERQLLAAVAAGARTRERAFVAAAAKEEAPFLGDTIAFDRLEELARGAQPLVTADAGLELTAAGAEVLAGRADRVALIGFDRRLGGMHLRAGNGLWRWDAARGALLAP